MHYVTAELDGGPVIAQARMAVLAGDDEHSLAQRLLGLEHQLLPAVVRHIAAAGWRWVRSGVALDGAPIAAPLQWRDGRLGL